MHPSVVVESCHGCLDEARDDSMCGRAGDPESLRCGVHGECVVMRQQLDQCGDVAEDPVASHERCSWCPSFPLRALAASLSSLARDSASAVTLGSPWSASAATSSSRWFQILAASVGMPKR